MEMHLCTSIKYGIILLWMSVSFIIPVLIHVRGLLLHRDVLPHKSSCINDQFITCYKQLESIDDLRNCLKFYNDSYITSQYCLPNDFKVIIIIIDALRYDFMEYDDKVDEGSTPFKNQMKVIKSLLDSEKEKSRLFRFIAHPPTTTMQRIKGLTTGTLPTFVDIGSNFMSSEINEDNVIDQLILNKKNAVFLGDDTWCKLYPNRFIRSFPFDSFNVWDLDTVDYGIQKNLIPELRKDDWHLLIAHFLGVDHCGHRYGPFHPEMKRKLNEMNDLLTDVIYEIKYRDNVLLFVVGDHGMTITGDHGGDTENEITTAMFVYSPVYPLQTNFSRQNNVVSQVDFVPTLSLLLGIPVPFSNMGRIVLECVPSTVFQPIFNSVFLLWQNVEQITTYIKEYSYSNSQLAVSKQIDLVWKHYYRLKEMWLNINNDNVSTFVRECDSYMETVLHMCQDIWVQFNWWFIAFGTSCMGLTVILWFIIIGEPAVSSGYRYLSQLYPLLVISSCFTLFFVPFFSLLFSVSLELIMYTLGEFCFILFLIRLCFNRYSNVKFVFQLKYNHRSTNFFIFGVYFCSLLALFANSFILKEASVMLFFSLSCMWMLVFHCCQFNYLLSIRSVTDVLKILAQFFRTKIITYAILISIGFRIAFMFLRCREDEDNCQHEITEKYNISLEIVAIIFLTLFVSVWRTQIKIVNFSLCQRLAKLCTILLSMYWLSEMAGVSVQWFRFIDKIPAVVLIICTIMICYLLCNPLLYLTDDWKDKYCTVESKCGIFIENESLIFDSAWANISVFFCIASCTLLGQQYAVSTISMFVCCHYLTKLLNSFEDSSSLLASGVSWKCVIIWAFSCTYWFHVTGHYASFSGIQWNAAFLIQKEIGSNMIVPGTLVMMNTFISYIVHGFLLTSLLTSQDITKYLHLVETGCLLETIKKKEDTFYDDIFQLTSKYIICVALRLLIVMSSSALHSRHLMMWRIFAPKLIFEGIAFAVVTIPSLLLGTAFVFRMKNILKIKHVRSCRHTSLEH